MTNQELGEKIEQAMYLWIEVRDGPSFRMVDSSEQTRITAREQLGEVVREILIEAVQSFMDAPIERTRPNTGQ